MNFSVHYVETMNVNILRQKVYPKQQLSLENAIVGEQPKGTVILGLIAEVCIYNNNENKEVIELRLVEVASKKWYFSAYFYDYTKEFKMTMLCSAQRDCKSTYIAFENANILKNLNPMNSCPFTLHIKFQKEKFPPFVKLFPSTFVENTDKSFIVGHLIARDYPANNGRNSTYNNTNIPNSSKQNNNESSSNSKTVNIDNTISNNSPNVNSKSMKNISNTDTNSTSSTSNNANNSINNNNNSNNNTSSNNNNKTTSNNSSNSNNNSNSTNSNNTSNSNSTDINNSSNNNNSNSTNSNNSSNNNNSDNTSSNNSNNNKDSNSTNSNNSSNTNNTNSNNSVNNNSNSTNNNSSSISSGQQVLDLSEVNRAYLTRLQVYQKRYLMNLVDGIDFSLFVVLKDVLKPTSNLDNGNRHTIWVVTDPSCDRKMSKDVLVHIFFNKPEDQFPGGIEVDDIIHLQKITGSLYVRTRRMDGLVMGAESIVKYKFNNDGSIIPVTQNLSYSFTDDHKQCAKLLKDWWREAKDLYASSTESPMEELRSINGNCMFSRYFIVKTIKDEGESIVVIVVHNGNQLNIPTYEFYWNDLSQEWLPNYKHRFIGSGVLHIMVLRSVLNQVDSLQVGDAVFLHNVSCILSEKLNSTGESGYCFKMLNEDCRIMKLSHRDPIRKKMLMRLDIPFVDDLCRSNFEGGEGPSKSTSEDEFGPCHAKHGDRGPSDSPCEGAEFISPKRRRKE